MVADSENLLKRIEVAFGSAPAPAQEQMLRDISCRDSECDAIRRDLIGKDWRALKIGTVAYRHSLPLYLTSSGYRYYLPGLMRLSLLNPEIVDLPGYIANALTPPTNGQRRRASWMQDYKHAFTAEQQRVIRDFLRWANNRYEGGQWYESAGRALSAVWDDSTPRS